MSATEFQGLGLAVGTVRGARSFRVDPLGRLTGINYRSVWRPGENVATCRVKDDPYGALMNQVSNAIYNTVSAQVITIPKVSHPDSPDSPKPAKVVKPKHDRARCSCGFYAFYDGSDDYGATARISAIVEGYGETVIGTRGFRAEKARILALCLPKPATAHAGKRRWPLTRWLVKHEDIGRAAAPVCTLLGLWGVLAGLICGIGTGMWWLVAAAVLWAALAVYVIVSSFRAIDAKYDTVKSGVYLVNPYEPEEVPLTQAAIDKVRRNYPDVPIFDSFEAMVAAFPTDKGLEPSPETDPEFWDRTA